MKIYPNKLFHCKISLLPFFLTHSFLYFSSYKQFFHQPQKSSNPIQSPNHPIFPSYITIHPNPPLHFPTEPNTRKKKSQSSSNSTPPPPQFWKRTENCKFFSSTVERQPTRSNSASLDKPFFFFGRVETLPGRACIFNSRLSAPLHPLFHRRKKKGKKGTFPRVNVCVRVWSSAENTVLRWLRVTFHEIFARTPHVLTLVSRFVHVAPRRGLTGREN